MAGVVCHGQTAEIGKRIVEFCRTADVGRRKVQYGARGGRTLQRKVFMPIRMFFLKQFFLKKEKIIGFQKTRHSAHTQCTYTLLPGKSGSCTSNGAKTILRLKQKQVDCRLRIVTAPETQKEARRNGVEKETNKDKSSSGNISFTCDDVRCFL
mmetsp:Transcript_65791/g.106665  ORF Transcript_65791/g.106665 Transcript_65791/m.106665 type:complete len:153 (+) Transcript_65791:970-1428(+)